jgi:hydroxypyruvate isomerase
MDYVNRPTRRDLLKTLTASTALAALGLNTRPLLAQDKPSAPALKGRIRQGACGGVFGKGMTLEQKCELCVKLGIKGMDFVSPNDWPTLQRHGLICTLTSSFGLSKGLNRKENHDEALAALRKSIEATAAAGFPNVVCFPGNRAGLSDDLGAENTVEGLKKIVAFAEEKKVTLCMELLNSKRNHKDYQCDRTAWGADVCKRVGSPRMKLLYDIYHMQVQEGDVIATLREFMPYIGHIHTAGVPGRHEIDDSQELYYPAIMRAIVDLKYDGYVSHEYTPVKDAATSLAEAVRICDV